MEIKLGSKVKDTVTNLEGIAVSRHIYLNGCHRYCVQPPLDKDGKVPDAHYIDEHQLEVIAEPKKITEGNRTTGGPRPTPKGMTSPKRRGI